MSDKPTSDDPELRAMLDSLGILPSAHDITSFGVEEDRRLAEELAAHIVLQPRGRRRRFSQDRPTLRRWTILGVATGIVICLVAVTPLLKQNSPANALTPAMLVFGDASKHSPSLSGETAIAALNVLANEAGRAPTPASQLVQHVEIDAWYASSDPADKSKKARSVLVPVRRNSYLLPNGDLRAIERRGSPLDASGRISDVHGSWDDMHAVTDEIAKAAESADYPSTLPRNPNDLARRLAPQNGCAQTRADCLLSAVGELHLTYVISPEISAALWRALATEPTVTSLGTTVDRLGRTVIALTAPALSSGEKQVLLADPRTGEYLGSETILTKKNADFAFSPPAVIAFSTVIDSDRVAPTDVPDDSKTKRY